MRIVLSADMEGISQLRDVRELLAWRAEYWETGRSRLTDDVVAAASGLLEGGASEVVVLDNHASGNPCNILADRLPPGARVATWNVFDLPALDIDGMVQVGYHPRRGVAGFAPHTYIPGLRLWVDDEEISESHGRAWAACTPLLGITGHVNHASSLGSFSGTQFLAVQGGDDPHQAEPLFADPQDASDSIREFTRATVRAAANVPRPAPPAHFTFTATLEHADDAQIGTMLAGGWTHVSDGQFAKQLASWADAREPLAAAMSAAMAPFAADLAAFERLTAGFLESLRPA